MAKPRLVLASASPRRSELLRGVGLSFEVVPSRVEEWPPRGAPEAYALELARAKALEVAGRIADPGSVVLGADTIVVLEGDVLGKPRDGEEARAMLRRLSGREHTVVTAFCLARPAADVIDACAVTTAVEFKRLSERDIRGYVATGEPRDKAGAYAAQGVGMALLRGVRGSYTNVVGLPVCEVVEALERHAVVQLFPGEA